MAQLTHAVFETGGKQHRVKEGDEIYIELIAAEGEKVKFDKVLAVLKDNESKIGAPYVKGATVSATVLKTGKAKKIIVYKMKNKINYRRKQGHRQPYMKVRIDKIALRAAKDNEKE